jgi:hypothetical protein
LQLFAVAEKEAFAAEASEAQSRTVALHQELSQAKTACAEVCGALWAFFIPFRVIVVWLVSVGCRGSALREPRYHFMDWLKGIGM